MSAEERERREIRRGKVAKYHELHAFIGTPWKPVFSHHEVAAHQIPGILHFLVHTLFRQDCGDKSCTVGNQTKNNTEEQDRLDLRTTHHHHLHHLHHHHLLLLPLYRPRSPLRRLFFFFLEQETLQHALPTYLLTYSPNHQNTHLRKNKTNQLLSRLSKDEMEKCESVKVKPENGHYCNKRACARWEQSASSISVMLSPASFPWCKTFKQPSKSLQGLLYKAPNPFFP